MDNHYHSGLMRKPSNKWTSAQYVTLAYLARTYQNEWKDLAMIFNKCFQPELPTSDGISAQALAAMWYDIQRKTCSKTARELLHSTSDSFISISSRLVDQAFIEKIAIDLRIQLVKRVPEPVLKSPHPVELHNISRKREVVQSDINMSDTETSFSSIKSQTDVPPSTPKRRRTKLVLETPEHSIAQVSEIGLLTPPSTRTSGQRSQLPERKKLPRIAFRAFSEGSQGINSVGGFRAGAFVDSPTIPPPPSPAESYYRDEALRHVAPIHSGPTPLISVTRNLVRALHRALKIGPTSFIAIIDVHKADRDGRVQSATMLRLQVDHLYRPHGEYLIWGGIDAAAIISVVGLPELLTAIPAMPSDADPFRIATMHANQFLMPVRQSFRDDPLPMSFHAGKAVGGLLHALSIPAEVDLCDAAVHSFLADWKFEGRWSNWRANTSFRSGVEQAYREKQGERETLLMFKELAERATKTVDERATEEDYDLDRAANADQATEDFPDHTCGESIGLDPEELVVSAVAIKNEHDSLDNNAHRIAWSNLTFGFGRDTAEKAETEQYTRTDHIPDESPSFNDDEAFATDFISKLQDFVNIQSSEVATSMYEASSVPPTDHSDWLDDLGSGRYETEIALPGLPPGELPSSTGSDRQDGVLNGDCGMVDTSNRGEPVESSSRTGRIHEVDDTSNPAFPPELLPLGEFNGSHSWVPENHPTLSALNDGPIVKSTDRHNKAVERSLVNQYAGSRVCDTKRSRRVLYEHAWTGM